MHTHTCTHCTRYTHALRHVSSSRLFPFRLAKIISVSSLKLCFLFRIFALLFWIRAFAIFLFRLELFLFAKIISPFRLWNHVSFFAWAIGCPALFEENTTAAASNNCFLLLGPSQKRSYLEKYIYIYATCQLEIIVPYSHTPLKEKHNHMSRFDQKYSRTGGSDFNTVIISVLSSFLAFKSRTCTCRVSPWLANRLGCSPPFSQHSANRLFCAIYVSSAKFSCLSQARSWHSRLSLRFVSTREQFSGWLLHLVRS